MTFSFLTRGDCRIWTGDDGVADRGLTTWLSHLIIKITLLGVLAPQVGLEPTTLRLTAECSTDWAIEDYLKVCTFKTSYSVWNNS